MNHRQRALAAMLGQPVDHIPFIARMDLWYSYHRNTGTLPHPYEKATLWEMQRDMGVGIFGFGAWDVPFYRLAYAKVDISVANEDGATVKVTWQPRSDPNASWWDVTAKEFPTQRFQLKPEAEQTLVILKGGGTVTFETKGDEEKAWIEFLVDD